MVYGSLRGRVVVVCVVCGNEDETCNIRVLRGAAENHATSTENIYLR